jgi:hypothetical protein
MLNFSRFTMKIEEKNAEREFKAYLDRLHV